MSENPFGDTNPFEGGANSSAPNPFAVSDRDDIRCHAGPTRPLGALSRAERPA